MARVIGKVKTQDEANAILRAFRARGLRYPADDQGHVPSVIDGWIHYNPETQEYVVFSDEPGPEGPVIA